MTRTGNFGIFGGNLGRFADLRGFVPEIGDDLENFTFPGDWEWEDGEWDEFVAAAAAAVAKAEKDLAKWREGQ